MKTFTPEIAWHNRDPVYSVDIQPKILDASINGSSSSSPSHWYRLATSGTNSQVVIWKVWHNSKSPGSVEIDPVSQLTRHEKAVNVVRFTPTGENTIASADVDGIIILWKLETSNAPAVAAPIESKKTKEDADIVILTPIDDVAKTSKQSINKDEDAEEAAPNLFEEETIKIEVWNQWKTLRGHLEDVVDLSWSSNGTMLVSASVDNEAIVWDAIKGVKLHMLTGHKSWVQGVSFDPINEYLVSLGADRNLRIYNCSSRKFMYKVDKGSVLHEEGSFVKTRLFYDYTLPSFTRRLAFSPGGEFLLAPSGVIELPRKSSIENGNGVASGSENKENELITIDDDEENADVEDNGDVEENEDVEMAEEGSEPMDEDGEEEDEISVKSGESIIDNESDPSKNKGADPISETPKKKVKILTKRMPKSDESMKVEKKTENDDEDSDMGYVNVCHLFLRQDLKRPFCYFPTDKFCHAVRFCPIRFKLNSPEDIESDFPYPYRIIFAIATQSSVILYDSSQLDPFGYISDIHYTRISDLSWSPDGRLLMISSTDGFCTFVTFQEGELGEVYDGPTFNWEPEVKEPPKMSDEVYEEIFSAVIANALATPDSNSCHPEVEEKMEEEIVEEVKPEVAVPKPATPKTPSIASIFTKVPKSEGLKKTFNSALFTAVPGSKRKDAVNGEEEVVVIDTNSPRVNELAFQSPQVKKLKDSNGNATPGSGKKPPSEKNYTSPSMLFVPVKRTVTEKFGEKEFSKDFENLVGKSNECGNIKIIDDNKPPTVPSTVSTSSATVTVTGQSAELKSPIKSDQKKMIVPRRVSFVTLAKPKET